MKKENKGFTLIELLAVIVILAVLILLAMPNVIRLMESARRNAFKLEAEDLLKYSETAYSDMAMNGKVKTVYIKEGGVTTTQYRYLCMTLQDLYDGGYTGKDFSKTDYTGYVEIFIPSSGDAVYGISMSNGIYSVTNATNAKLQDDGYQLGTYASVTNTCPTIAQSGGQNVVVPNASYSAYKN